MKKLGICEFNKFSTAHIIFEKCKFKADIRLFHRDLRILVELCELHFKEFEKFAGAEYLVTCDMCGTMIMVN